MQPLTSEVSNDIKRRLLTLKPRDDEALRGWIAAMLGLHVPDTVVCLNHVSPMHYLSHVFFEKPGDPIVWANRGGGKTFYGAIATLLDMIFKPGIHIRILGGSLEQSERMYTYLRDFLDRNVLRNLVDGKITRRDVSLINGSHVQLLAQSEQSVRGQRVQKLRCDEVELFDREVWDAAQFTTKSKQCDDISVRGGIEVFSTMHRPFGLMNELIQKAKQPQTAWKLLPWCAIDVMSQCEPERNCDTCDIQTSCEGRAKNFTGFLAVKDVIAPAQTRLKGNLQRGNVVPYTHQTRSRLP